MQTAQGEVENAGRGSPASVRLDEARSAVYITDMATPAGNIATVVIAATVHPKREFGWPCISFLSEATTRIAKTRKGSRQSVDDSCPAQRLRRINACPKSNPMPTPVEKRMRVL